MPKENTRSLSIWFVPSRNAQSSNARYIQSSAAPDDSQSVHTDASAGASKPKASSVPMPVSTKPRRKSSPSSVFVVFGEVMGVKSVHSSVTGEGSPTVPPCVGWISPVKP